MPQSISIILCASADSAPSCSIKYCTAIRVHSEHIFTPGPFTSFGTIVFGLPQKLQYSNSIFGDCSFVSVCFFDFEPIETTFCSLLIEIIFSLDGLGLLGYEAIITRDYPVIFGTLYIFTLFGLIATPYRAYLSNQTHKSLTHQTGI